MLRTAQSLDERCAWVPSRRRRAAWAAWMSERSEWCSLRGWWCIHLALAKRSRLAARLFQSHRNLNPVAAARRVIQTTRQQKQPGYSPGFYPPIFWCPTPDTPSRSRRTRLEFWRDALIRLRQLGRMEFANNGVRSGGAGNERPASMRPMLATSFGRARNLNEVLGAHRPVAALVF